MLGGEGGAADAAGPLAAKSAVGDYLTYGLQKIQDLMEGNASQKKSLTEVLSKSNERIDQMEKMVGENAAQIKALSDGQSANRKQMKESVQQSEEQFNSLTEGQTAYQGQMKGLVQQSKDELKSLAQRQAASTEQFQQALEQSAKASGDMAKELKRQRQQNQSQGANNTAAKSRVDCTHNVHPPPRKIEKTVIGYDYGYKIVKGAKEKPAEKVLVPPPATKDIL